MSNSRDSSQPLPTDSQSAVSTAINLYPGGDLNDNEVHFLGTAVLHPKAAWEETCGVFDAAKLTTTGQNSYDTDNAESDFKMLRNDRIHFPSAMALAKEGTKQNVIRGDSVTYYLRGRYCEIDGDDDLIVKQKQTYHIKNDATFLCDEKYAIVVRDWYDLAVHGQSTTFVLGASSAQFVGQHEVTCPEEFEWKHFEKGFSYEELDLATWGWDIHVNDIGVAVKDIDVELLEEGSKFVKKCRYVGKHTAAALETEAGAKVQDVERANVNTELANNVNALTADATAAG